MSYRSRADSLISVSNWRNRSEGLSGYFEYKDQLFAPDRVAQMQEHFVRLLQGFVSDPAAHIGELPLLSEAERRDRVLAGDHPREPAERLVLSPSPDRSAGPANTGSDCGATSRADADLS